MSTTCRRRAHARSNASTSASSMPSSRILFSPSIATPSPSPSSMPLMRIGGGDKLQRSTLVGVSERLLLVARRHAYLDRQQPDLKKVHVIGLRCVVLAVQHTCAGAHPLHVARADRGPRAHRVLMRERALE